MSNSHPPGPPAGRFGLRQAAALRRDPLGFVRSVTAKFGDVVHFRLGPAPCYLFAHPDHVHEILVRQARHFRKTARFRHVFARFEGDGVLTTDGETWADLRRQIPPVFAPTAVDDRSHAMVAVAARALDQWPASGEVDLASEMPAVIGRLAAETLFGVNVDDLANRLGEVAAARQRWAHRELNRVLPTPRWLPLFGPAGRARSLLRAVADRVIRVGRVPGLADGPRARDRVGGLFLASYETLAIALSWAGGLVARNLDVQEQVAAELPGGPTADRAFHEALRLYPPVYLFSRQPAEPVGVGGYTLPPGSQVFLSPYLTQRDPRWFPEPDRFDPGRFAPEVEAERPPCGWFPFGAGPRVCIGRAFALRAGAIVLSLLARRYRLEPVNEFEPVAGLFLLPGQVRIRFRPRE